MIEGLKVLIPTVEMKKRLGERVEYHVTRRAFYTDQLRQLDTHRDALTQVVAGGSVGVPVLSVREAVDGKVKHHAARASYLAFIADHLEPAESYRLGNYEIRELEFTE
jgi:hypothetical protein